jgi:hypothetical protein
MDLYRLYEKVSPLFRRKRLSRFVEIMAPTKETRILDVGGYPWFWTDPGFPLESKFTILNPDVSPAAEKYRSSQFELVMGDGTSLNYADGEFDIVFSNSVIEHLGTEARQIAFANEATRVGKRYWIQTPAKEFLIEPHFIAPFIHWFPKTVQRRLIRRWTVWGWLRHPSAREIESMLGELRLLRRVEFQRLFPSAKFITERLGLWPKSYVAYKDAG